MGNLQTTVTRADSALVDKAERGEQIRRRRLALGIRGVSRFAVLTGVSRSAASNAEHGRGARGTYERLEAWLTVRESAEQPAPEAETLEQISLHAEGEDWKFTVSGPVADREQLKADLLDLVREMRRGE